MATNDIQFYAIANLDMTSLLRLITAVERLKAAALACVICSLVHEHLFGFMIKVLWDMKLNGRTSKLRELRLCWSSIFL